MSFISLSFLLFLGILIILYYALPHKWQWVILLIASYVFYLFAGVRYLAFILFTTITSFLAIRFIDKKNKLQKEQLAKRKETMSKEAKKAYKKQIKAQNRLVMILCIVLNFGILFFCKACLVEPLHSAFSSNATFSSSLLGQELNSILGVSTDYLYKVYLLH